MAKDKDTRREERNSRDREEDLYLGCLTKLQLILITVAVGIIILIAIITVSVVLTTNKELSQPNKGEGYTYSVSPIQRTQGSPAPFPSFPPGGDMLDYLVQAGEISQPDGLFASWFHRANSKEEMNEALSGNVMILEADVTLRGYGTPSEEPVPIMAHPPAVQSDNTLDEWLDAVLASRKAMKLDFKALESVGLSLDLLSQKNSSRRLNRPVWLNADILIGPNTPGFMPTVNGSRFLQLVQEKFPDATLSPGWMVSYAPPLFTSSYTRAMVEDMYGLVKDCPQKVTFPVHALLVRSGWQHLSWLLSQSPRFSLTLWQGSIHPNVSDLQFVRDNSNPARVYYDIYEPTLSEFKEAATRRSDPRRFYPGGDLMDFLHPTHNSDNNLVRETRQCSSLEVRWFTVTDQTSLLPQLSGRAGGMLVIHVSSDSSRPGVPVVEGSGKSSELLSLQGILELLGQNAEARWGIYLQIQSHQLLETSLQLLHSFYSSEDLYRPVWIGMEGLQSSDDTQDFVSMVEKLFPYVTVVLPQQNYPPLIPAAVAGLSQRVALRLNSLPAGQEELNSLMGMMDKCDFLLEVDTKSDTEASSVLKMLMSQKTGGGNANLYVI